MILEGDIDTKKNKEEHQHSQKRSEQNIESKI